jgi:acyl dehydratase
VLRTFNSIDELRTAAGEHLGYSDWHLIDQDRVNAFADATGDHQWIHVDIERARRESPFGGPVAHGFLTLSLLPWLLSEILSVTGVKLGVNYGLNRVRFPAPVPVGSRVRAGGLLTSVEEIPGGVQAVTTVTIEVEGQEKPACVAESVARFYA